MDNILIITGSYPPQICGVGDYTHRLVHSKNTESWQLYHSKDWNIKSLFCHIRTIKQSNTRVINMQYPTQGYGWSIVPHLLCIYFSWFSHKLFSVTIHEQSQLSFKARLAQWFILLSANKIIFTNEFELNYARKYVPYIIKRSTVIKIFSNICGAEKIKPIDQRKIDLVNFGHIRPNKGLEKFIETVSQLTTKYNIHIAGQIPQGYEEYFERIKTKAEKSGITILLNLSDIEISNLLNNTKLVYLPFPDGVSERRGSLLASFANGAAVATTVGKFTTQNLKKAIIEISKYTISEILNDTNMLSLKQLDSLNFIKTEMPQGWDDIVAQYNNFLR